MKTINTNLYYIDDVLIRFGRFFVVVAIVSAFVILEKSGASAVSARSLLLIALLAAAPVAMLGFGHALRRREKRIVGIHRLVKKHGEMPVADLVSSTGLNRRALRNAVALLNRKSVAGLVWDERTNCVRHISLGTRKTLTHSERCSSCGASVNVEVSTLTRAPELACPYCAGALNSRAISRLQNELHLQEGQILHQQAPLAFSSRPAPHGKPFNWVLFVILMMFFWPFGILYAIKYARSARHLEDLLERDRRGSGRRY